MAVLPQILDVHVAVPTVAGLGLLVCAAVFVRWRKALDLREIGPLVLGEAIGTPLGVFLLVTLDRGIVLGVLGTFLLAYGLYALRPGAPPAPAAPPPRRWGVLAGVLGGMLGGAFNTGGPPLIVYGTVRGWSPAAFRANLQAVFLFNCVLQIALLGANGLLGGEVLRLQALALPALALGLIAGTRLGARLDVVRFRKAIHLLLALLGAVYLVRLL